STGGRTTLLGISKRGNKKIRTLLVQCARVFIQKLEHQSGKLADWVRAKFAQRAKNVKLALNSKITHLNSRSQSALASNILVQHIEQPMHRYLFLRLMD
ncbi:transposase, partial [Enterobacter sichuanensis]